MLFEENFHNSDSKGARLLTNSLFQVINQSYNQKNQSELLFQTSPSLAYPCSFIEAVNITEFLIKGRTVKVSNIVVAGIGLFGHGGELPLEVSELLYCSTRKNKLRILLDVYNHFLLSFYFYLLFNLGENISSPNFRMEFQKNVALLKSSRFNNENLKTIFSRRIARPVQFRFRKCNYFYYPGQFSQGYCNIKLYRKESFVSIYHRRCVQVERSFEISIYNVLFSEFSKFEDDLITELATNYFSELSGQINRLLIRFKLIDDRNRFDRQIGTSLFLSESKHHVFLHICRIVDKNCIDLNYRNDYG